MTKSIAFAVSPPRAADAFVQGYAADAPATVPAAPPEKIARVTVEIPASLHRAFKAKAASEGHKIANLVRGWVEGYANK
jgi:hypothetical protein